MLRKSKVLTTEDAVARLQAAQAAVIAEAHNVADAATSERESNEQQIQGLYSAIASLQTTNAVLDSHLEYARTAHAAIVAPVRVDPVASEVVVSEVV